MVRDANQCFRRKDSVCKHSSTPPVRLFNRCALVPVGYGNAWKCSYFDFLFSCEGRKDKTTVRKLIYHLNIRTPLMSISYPLSRWPRIVRQMTVYSSVIILSVEILKAFRWFEEDNNDHSAFENRKDLDPGDKKPLFVGRSVGNFALCVKQNLAVPPDAGLCP